MPTLCVPPTVPPPPPWAAVLRPKEKGLVPLWKLIADQPCPNGSLEVIESLQIAPEWGGMLLRN